MLLLYSALFGKFFLEHSMLVFTKWSFDKKSIKERQR
jgi:hypothetical protein